MRFRNKVLFATGAGSGIGATTVERFTAEGGRVAIADLDVDRAESVAAQLEGAIAIRCDVSDETSVQNAVAATVREFGRIDGVLNAAGHAKPTPTLEVTREDWDRMLAVHVTGTFLVCQATMPVLRDSGGGSIVNLASVAALIGRPNLAAYSAAKGAIIALSRQLAVDGAPDGIRVNCVAAGAVRTPMTEPIHIQHGDGDWEAGAAMISSYTLQKRIGMPEEITAPLCFLLADESSFFTGSLMVPDGGVTAL